MTFLEINAAVAGIILRHSVVWLPAEDAETPHIAYSAEELARQHWRWASRAVVPVPDYSRNWADCREVITSMINRGYHFDLRRSPNTHFWAGFAKGGNNYIGAAHEIAATAVCLSAFRAVGAWDDDYLSEVIRCQRIKRRA